MFKGLADLFLKLSDRRPNYTGSRCLVERQAVGGCDRCAAVCPHQAIEIGSTVTIFDDTCTGCGLCVGICPSGALEYDVAEVLALLKDQGIGMSEAPSPASLRCSQVPGDGPSVLCLGRVTTAMLIVSAAWHQSLELVHADCASCALGSFDVPRALQKAIELASLYRKTLSTSGVVRMVQYGTQGETDAHRSSRAPLSRREALQGAFGNVRRAATRVVSDRPLPGVNAAIEAGPLPEEWLWRRCGLKPRSGDEVLQYWPTPVVSERCIFCPVCENVCPTRAIHRERLVDGSYRLELEVAACTGCDACVASCPPDAMRLEPYIETSKLSTRLLLREGTGF